RDGRQDPALHHARAAVRLHGLHPELPGRPDRLLDHDEPVDRRSAVHHPQDRRTPRQAPARRREPGPRCPAAPGDGQGGAGTGRDHGQRRQDPPGAEGRRLRRRDGARGRADRVGRGRGIGPERRRIAPCRAAAPLAAQEEAKDRAPAL
ncbi:MAG: hypothetical protein AVDCRST_MAG79-3034, partial [uncultured Thermoleophilia bacterium]